ncbi:hypothetical protein HPB52_010906 [Rhipicephalus sanguineus]|uniref:RNA helicase n=1 Tax=Rhipicephalus sanguineus TaxID=34632 RepID=A0A9D4SND5_RHISA|nr:hypothetical protein HPB52_010906 [Rhipicephalus sanguineus]
MRRCAYLVLHEAERMMSTGFENQLGIIADNRRSVRETLVWLSSRTLDTDQLIQDLTSDYVTVSVGAPAHQDHNRPVQHIFYFGEEAKKEAKLIDPLNDIFRQKNDNAILFVDRRQMVEVALKQRLHGKHLAYLVPAIIHILNQPAVFSGYGPLVLVLTATREAALQIREVADAFITRSGIRTIYLLPGEPREPQLKQLEEDAHICVATPGRLVSFMEESKISLRRCSFLVLDEADQMVTMGFGKQLRTIADNTRPDRQTLVWLSSRTKDANQLIEDLTSDSITVTIGVATHEGDNFEVEHIVCVSETIEKEEKLTALFNDTLSVEGDKAIVFVERKQTVDDLVCNLRLQGWLAVGIHGKKTEQERDYALNALRVGKVSILVATDAAASTLTALKVRLVVSYDYPSSEDEYSRRFMNAARPGGTGVMCTFLAPDETRRAKEVISLLRKAKQNIPPELINVAKNVPRR